MLRVTSVEQTKAAPEIQEPLITRLESPAICVVQETSVSLANECGLVAGTPEYCQREYFLLIANAPWTQSARSW
jgi:hypothetical protein